MWSAPSRKSSSGSRPPIETASLDLVAVGEILVDLMGSEAGRLQETTQFLRAAGGAPANVASAVARLGGSSAMIGTVGDDPFGEFLRATLRHNGVDVSGLRTVAERTSLAFVAANQGGIPDFLFYRGADAALRPEDVRGHLLDRAAFLYITSMSLMAEPARSAVLYAIDMARDTRTSIVVDPNLRPSSWPSIEVALDAIAPIFEAADILKMNDEEARLITGHTNPQQALAALGGEERVTIVTLGHEGCLWRRREETGVVPAPGVDVVDTTGAGDAFVGGLIVALRDRGYSSERISALSIDDLTTALAFACATASLSCAQPGAMSSLPAREEVEQLLRGGGPK